MGLVAAYIPYGYSSYGHPGLVKICVAAVAECSSVCTLDWSAVAGFEACDDSSGVGTGYFD